MKLTEKEKKIIKAIDQLLPKVKISPQRAGNIKSVTSSHFYIPPDNVSLEGSDYFYDKKLTFVHFTSLVAIKSIVTNKNIRLYNLDNLNDPREYSYAGDLILFNKQLKNHAKQNFYLFSMCNKNVLFNNTENEFNLWRLFGQNGFGVAVIINFDSSFNEPINWCDYFLSKVYYSDKSRANLRKLGELLNKLETEKPIVRVDLGQIVMFHKSRLYKLEQEIRLLFDHRTLKKPWGPSEYRNSDNQITSPIIKADIEKSIKLNKEISYLELPIYHKNFKPVYEKNQIPIPKIEKIILGYCYKKYADYLIQELKELCDTHLQYSVDIEESRLTKYYHDIEVSDKTVLNTIS